MGHIFVYSIESSLLLAAMYLAYKWALASERQHAFNRLVLWSIYAMALTLPLCGALRPVQQTDVMDATVTVEATDFAPMLTVVDESAAMSWLTLAMRIVLWIYLVGAVVVIAHTVMVAVRLAMIVRLGERRVIVGRKVVLIDSDGIAPFSVMRTIVLSRRDFAEAGDMIFEHESSHVRLNHWIDLLMAQLVAIFQWYNPAAWLMREELKAVHEYQADAGVMASGVNVKQYQMLLIKKAVGARFPSLANSLNHSKLKKRITMMYNPKTSRTRRLRALVLAPALGGALFVTNIPAVADVFDSVSDASLVLADDKVSQNSVYEQPMAVIDDAVAADAAAPVDEMTAEKRGRVMPAVVSQSEPAVAHKDDNDGEKVGGQINEITVVGYLNPPEGNSAGLEEVRGRINGSDDDDRVFSVVDKAPMYPGGQLELMKFVSKNIRYPKDAHDDSIQGRVILQFVVAKNGKVTSPKIIRGVCPSIDAEAKRVVMMLPDFIPGEMSGKPVAVEYTLPILFKLTPAKPAREKEEAPAFTVTSKDLKTQGVAMYVDGKRVYSIDDIDPKTIERIDVVKSDPRHPDGAVYVKLKDSSAGTKQSME